MRSTLLRTRDAESVLQFPRDVTWHSSVRKRAGAWLGPQNGWSSWCRHLERRAEPKPVEQLLDARHAPLSWTLGPALARDETKDLVDGLFRFASGGRRAHDGHPQEALRYWLAESSDREPDVALAVECLAWCRVLSDLAPTVDGGDWWALVERLVTAADDAAGIDLDERPLEQQLLAGELGLTLNYQLPEIDQCRRLERPARKALAAGLDALLDRDGMPHGRHLRQFPALLACWTRCLAIGRHLRFGAWNAAAHLQYEWAVRQALRLLQSDGTSAFADDMATAYDVDMVTAALRFGGDRDDRAIAARLLPGTLGPKSGRRRHPRSLPEPASESEWAQVAVLRTGWEPSASTVVVDYSGPTVSVQCCVGRTMLFSGGWPVELCFNGRRVETRGDWDQVCWISDEDGDYLELECELSMGLRLERQLMLAREDRFLYLCDVVLGQHRGSIECRTMLPLAADVSFDSCDATRDGYLVSTAKRRARVLPIGLSEWRHDPRRNGNLVLQDCELVLSREVDATGLMMPWFFDLHPRRLACEATWRQLTVGESMLAVPGDVAEGFRVQVGRRQWVIYRSLAPVASRTLLGHNLSSQFMLAQFDGDGTVTELVEIE